MIMIAIDELFIFNHSLFIFQLWWLIVNYFCLQLREVTAERDRLQKLCDELSEELARLKALLARLQASGDEQAKYILKV